jgi:hypothetical protein
MQYVISGEKKVPGIKKSGEATTIKTVMYLYSFVKNGANNFIQ